MLFFDQHDTPIRFTLAAQISGISNVSRSIDCSNHAFCQVIMLRYAGTH